MPNEQIKINHLIEVLRQRYDGLWASLSEQQRARVRAVARDAKNVQGFLKNVKTMKGYKAWAATQETPPDDDPTDPEIPDDPDDEEDPETPADEEDDEVELDQNVLDLLSGFLTENGLPSSLLAFIQSALAEKKGFSQIIAELRQTDEYKQAYPENAIRQANGFDWIPEAQIRGLRSEIRRLGSEYLGVADITQDELNNVIGKNWSLSTWETKLQRYREFERWGPTVRSVLEQELGYSLDDERLFAFFDDTPTPELDNAYERSLMRAQPAVLGLGIRPEDEVELLRRYGIKPEQAFSGYQNLAKELPRTQRLGLIDAEIGRNADSFPTGTELFADTPFATLFRAIQLGDGEAITKLQTQMAREVARWQGQGGAVTDNSGASIGLLDPDER